MGALDERVGLVTGGSKGLGAAIRLSGCPQSIPVDGGSLL